MTAAIDVAAALVVRNGRLLIARRSAGSHLAGLWEFPGGKREPGESWEDCLRRELAEELGVTAAVGELVDEITFAYPEKTVRLRFFLARLVSGEPRPLDCAEVKWVGRADLAGHAFPPADAALIDRLTATDRFWEA